MTYHLTIDQFTSLKVDPESANDSELDHLVSCVTCRTKIAAVDHYFEMNAVCLDSKFGQSTEVDEKLSFSLLKSDNLTEEKSQAEKVSSVVDFKNVKRFKPTISIPVWSIAASFLISAFVGVWIINSQPEPSFLATYQDSTGVLISQPATGIGFFDENKQQRTAVNDVTFVKINSKLLIMKWPDFAKTNQYQVIVYENNSGNMVEEVITGRQIELSATQFIEHRNYQWLIKASSSNNLTYELRGGFILK